MSFRQFRTTVRKFFGRHIFIEYHSILSHFMDTINPQFSLEEKLLVLDGAEINLQELIFLLVILPKENRDIFALNFVGQPDFSENFADGTMQKRQWQKFAPDSPPSIFDWLRLNVTRIGGAKLEYALNNPIFRDAAEVEKMIHEQLEIERIRNPSLVAIWMANHSRTPFHKAPTQKVDKFGPAFSVKLDSVCKTPLHIRENPDADNISVFNIIIKFNLSNFSSRTALILFRQQASG